MIRRKFLQTSVVGAAAAMSGGPLSWLAFPRRAYAVSGGFDAISPIASLSGLGGLDSRDFNGDEIDRPHDILWNKDEYLAKHGGYPAITEKARVVVVGGGIAGLTAAYRLRDLQPLVLEQASRTGGNSKGESWNGSDFSLGAAYLSKPDPGSRVDRLLTELGLSGRVDTDEGEAVQWGASGPQKILGSFWNGVTDPSRADEFRAARALFLDINENSLPQIPQPPGSEEPALTREQLLALDKLKFSDWIDANLPRAHPHLREYLEFYCWSSFATESDELSAAQALSFLAADLAGILVLPGGNAAVARQLARGIGNDRLRCGSLVLDIAPMPDGGVRICYENAQREFRAIHADACVVASPKMVSQFTVSGMPASQTYAMSRLKYHAYLVINVLLRGPLASPGYDIFRLNGVMPGLPRDDLQKRPYTDLCFGNWAANDSGDSSVLTLYKALPYDGAQQFLFSSFAHEKHKAPVEKELESLLPALGISRDRVAGIRLTRWGHAIPVAQHGLLSSGYLEAACAPVADRIFFANQDNWANPCFETSHAAGEDAARAVRARLA